MVGGAPAPARRRAGRLRLDHRVRASLPRGAGARRCGPRGAFRVEVRATGGDHSLQHAGGDSGGNRPDRSLLVLGRRCGERHAAHLLLRRGGWQPQGLPVLAPQQSEGAEAHAPQHHEGSTESQSLRSAAGQGEVPRLDVVGELAGLSGPGDLRREGEPLPHRRLGRIHDVRGHAPRRRTALAGDPRGPDRPGLRLRAASPGDQRGDPGMDPRQQPGETEQRRLSPAARPDPLLPRLQRLPVHPEPDPLGAGRNRHPRCRHDRRPCWPGPNPFSASGSSGAATTRHAPSTHAGSTWTST